MFDFLKLNDNILQRTFLKTAIHISDKMAVDRLYFSNISEILFDNGEFIEDDLIGRNRKYQISKISSRLFINAILFINDVFGEFGSCHVNITNLVMRSKVFI